jgi:hypothetical protein
MATPPTPPTPPTPATPLTLEERKFAQEIADKKRDLDIREREVAAKEKELSRSRWSSPLVLALFAASLGLVGNIVVALVNNKNTQDLERLRAQSTLILEAIKGGSSETTCKNLVFLVGLGLLDDSTRSIHDRCENTPIGVPSLPAAQWLVDPNNWRPSSNYPIGRSKGVVQDSETGKPIAGAEISVPGLLDHLTSDEKGEFEFAPPNFWLSGNIVIDKDGYDLFVANYGTLLPPFVFKLHKIKITPLAGAQR